VPREDQAQQFEQRLAHVLRDTRQPVVIEDTGCADAVLRHIVRDRCATAEEAQSVIAHVLNRALPLRVFDLTKSGSPNPRLVPVRVLERRGGRSFWSIRWKNPLDANDPGVRRQPKIEGQRTLIERMTDGTVSYSQLKPIEREAVLSEIRPITNKAVRRVTARFDLNASRAADVQQELDLAALTALQQFVPSGGRSVYAYAKTLVERKAAEVVTRFIQGGSPIKSDHLRILSRKLVAVRSSLEAQLGRVPTTEEIAEAYVNKQGTALTAREVTGTGSREPLPLEDRVIVVQRILDYAEQSTRETAEGAVAAVFDATGEQVPGPIETATRTIFSGEQQGVERRAHDDPAEYGYAETPEHAVIAQRQAAARLGRWQRAIASALDEMPDTPDNPVRRVAELLYGIGREADRDPLIRGTKQAAVGDIADVLHARHGGSRAVWYSRVGRSMPRVRRALKENMAMHDIGMEWERERGTRRKSISAALTKTERNVVALLESLFSPRLVVRAA